MDDLRSMLDDLRTGYRNWELWALGLWEDAHPGEKEKRLAAWRESMRPCPF